MPQGILEAGRLVDVGVDEKHRPPEPPADPERAPKGWRLDRQTKTWVPRQRAPKTGPSDEEASDASAPPAGSDASSSERLDSAWATGRDGRDLFSDFVELTDAQRDDVRAILELFVGLPAIGLAARDPYCGGALVEAWPNICERSLPLIARSPALVDWLTKAGGARDWLMFGVALWPVGKAVARHHVTKTVELDNAGEPVEEDLGAYPA